jgi:hypothetical protein
MKVMIAVQPITTAVPRVFAPKMLIIAAELNLFVISLEILVKKIPSVSWKKVIRMSPATAGSP